MAHFIELGFRQGWINLDAVARIKQDEGAEGDLVYKFYSSDGALLGTARDVGGYFNPHTLSYQAVPAAAGCVAVVLSDWSEEDQRPTMEDIHAEEHHIVAWRFNLNSIGPVHAMPILAGAGEWGDTDPVLIKRPDGSYDLPFQASYRTIAEAKADYLERLQRIWDSERSAPSDSN
jgi:hypothetical protein